MRRYTPLATLASLLLLLTLGSCKQEASETLANGPEELVLRDSTVCYSLMGQPLKYLPETVSSYAEKDSALQVALANYKNDPGNLDNMIWYARRLCYLTEYPQAMSVYTRGLHIHPSSPELYRHRGHRYISMRRFEEAADDLRNAAALVRGRPIQAEPDGMPNPQNQPVSNLQFNIWYHLGLAYFLMADYEDALNAYDSCMSYSVNPDLVVATSYWKYLTLMRIGDRAAAEGLVAGIDNRMRLVENESYHKLLLMFKGNISPDELLSSTDGMPLSDLDMATLGYGAANYYFFKGDFEKGKETVERILQGSMWPAFGYIAAEADKARGLHTLKRPL